MATGGNIIENNKYYVGEVSRAEAEELLQEIKIPLFRKSTSEPGWYALTYFSMDGQIRHSLIKYDEALGSLVGRDHTGKLSLINGTTTELQTSFVKQAPQYYKATALLELIPKMPSLRPLGPSDFITAGRGAFVPYQSGMTAAATAFSGRTGPMAIPPAPALRRVNAFRRDTSENDPTAINMSALMGRPMPRREPTPPQFEMNLPLLDPRGTLGLGLGMSGLLGMPAPKPVPVAQPQRRGSMGYFRNVPRGTGVLSRNRAAALGAAAPAVPENAVAINVRSGTPETARPAVNIGEGIPSFGNTPPPTKGGGRTRRAKKRRAQRTGKKKN